jgi:hypothetical protein
MEISEMLYLFFVLFLSMMFVWGIILLGNFCVWIGEAYNFFNDRFIKTKPKTSNNKALS